MAYKRRKQKTYKRYHFLGEWKNGDRMNVCSYGTSKKQAFINILKARKEKKFKMNKGDSFHLKYKTIEESKGFGYLGAGHITYIVSGKKVEIN